MVELVTVEDIVKVSRKGSESVVMGISSEDMNPADFASNVNL